MKATGPNPDCNPSILVRGKPMLRRAFIAATLLSLLAACGFQLRGAQTLPFGNIYLAMNQYEDFTAALKRAIESTGNAHVVSKAEEADAILQLVANDKEKHILSLNSSGSVREYQLRQRFAYRVVDRKRLELAPYSEIYVYRDVSFSEGLELAKAQEDSLLYADMQNDVLQQLLRRLSRVHPK